MNKSILWYAFSYLYYYPFYLYGLWRISRLKKPIVTIFGGKRAAKNDPYYQQSFQLAGNLIEHNFSVLTGGGPGIMESALSGAVAHKVKNSAMGVGVWGIDVGFISAPNHETIFMKDFAQRKHLLIDFSCAFVCFPGGIGTLDEILEVLNLIKAKKLKRIPVILFGKNYWHFFVKWIEHAAERNFIAPEYANLLFVTDDMQEVLNKLVQEKKD